MNVPTFLGILKEKKKIQKNIYKFFFRILELILADLHNAMFLKMMTQVLFCSRHTEIRKTEKWKAMKKS